MIVTLTVNPAIDRTVDLPGSLDRGAVQRTIGTRDQAGGKGINVARALEASGLEANAVFPAAHDDAFTLTVRADGLTHRAVPIRGRVRTNLALTEPDGTTTKLNEAGPELASDEVDALLEAVVEASDGASWLVLAGSLPPSVDSLFYARVIATLRERYGERAPRIAIDSSGAPLRDTIASGQPVDLIKPNADELAELLGDEDGPTLEADPERAAEAGLRALELGVGSVLLTLGGAGAVLLERDTVLIATPPPITVASTVGAGDSSLAGYLYARLRGASSAEALAQAVAHGAAAASLPGSTLPAPADTQPHSVSIRHWHPATTPEGSAQ